MKILIILLIRLYQTLISRPLYFLLGPGCRFTPTCSEYTINAIRKYGIVLGTHKGSKRFLSCHSF